MRLLSIPLYTLMRKETLRIFRIWIQTLLPTPVSIGVYFLIFGTVLGNHIEQYHHFQGFSYMLYIAPGLMAMAVINNAYANTVASYFMAKFLRYIEEMMVSSMRHWEILCGFLWGGLVRGSVLALMIYLMGSCFTSLSVAHPFLLILVTLLVSLLMGGLGLINGVFARTFDEINVIPSFVLTPLIYLGGVFYSVEQLDPFWQKLLYWNPIFYIVDLFRYSILGVSVISWPSALLVIALSTVLVVALSFYLVSLGKGIRS